MVAFLRFNCCFTLPYIAAIFVITSITVVVVAEFYTLTDILVTFSGRIDDQNVVVDRINEVVVLTGYFY